MEKFIELRYPITYFESLMHVLTANLGTGLLIMGNILKNSGLILGSLLILLLGLLYLYCEHLLVNASAEMKNHLSIEKYPDFGTTVELCFANGPKKIQKCAIPMRKTVNVLICITQLGICCIYILFLSSTLKWILLESYGYDYSVRTIMVFLMVPIILACLIRNLKFLTPISALSNLFSLTGFTMCVLFLMKDIKMHETVRYDAKIRGLPWSLSIAIFAFGGISTVLPIKSEMENPPLYDLPLGVLNAAKCFALIMHFVLGTLTYIKYGETAKTNVLVNLRSTEAMSQIVEYFAGIAIVFTYPIHFYVPFQIFWIWIYQNQAPFRSPIMTEMGFKIVLVMLTFIASEMLHFLESFILLIGAVTSTTLSLLIPPILECLTAWKGERLSVWVILRDVLVFLIGILSLLAGTFEGVCNIMYEIKNRSDVSVIGRNHPCLGGKDCWCS